VTIAGMDDDLDLDRIAKVIRKTFHCNAAVVNKRDYEEIVEANEAKRREGGYLSLDDMIVKQTTPGKRMKFSRPMLHLDSGKVIILQGDYREGVIKLFKDAEIVLDESRLMIHG
jgi:translation initiation factor 1 (eIF-1/SUI1)